MKDPAKPYAANKPLPLQAPEHLKDFDTQLFKDQEAAYYVVAKLQEFYREALMDTPSPNTLSLALQVLNREVSREEVDEVLAFGAQKYTDGNWRTTENPFVYLDAALRHLGAHHMSPGILNGHLRDEETGFHHLAHVSANVLFLHDTLYRPLNHENPPDITALAKTHAEATRPDNAKAPKQKVAHAGSWVDPDLE